MAKISNSGGPGSRFRPGNNIDSYVRKEIERTGRASAENRWNAIAADGMPSIYYQKATTGPLCSCQSRESGLVADEIYPNEDLGESQSIESMVKAAPAFGRYQKTLDRPDDTDLTGSGLIDTAASAGVSRLAFDEGDGVACGICFRTGYETGYQLAAGLRLMLTARSHSQLGLMTELQSELKPMGLRSLRHKALLVQATPLVNPIPINASYVIWNSVELPFVWDNIRVGVFFNDQPVYDSWVVLRTGTQYWPLLGGKLTSTLGLLPDPNVGEGIVYVSADRPFTHCVIEFESLADRPVISFPQLSIAKLQEDFEGIASLTLEISGQTLGLVKTGDLLYVPRINKVLTVTGPVNRLLTPGLQQPVGWSTEARVIQPVELQTVLQELTDLQTGPFSV